MASNTNEAVRPATTYAEATEAEKHAVLRKVTGSSFLGNFIEWFDYASYSYFATVIALVLMPPGDPTVALLETVPSARFSGATWATRRVANGRFRYPSC